MGRPTLTERRKAQTRREIAETALALFARKGYDGVSAEAIAEEAGVSLRTFYRYFTGKDAVLSPIVTDGIDELAERLPARPAPESLAHALYNASPAVTPRHASRSPGLPARRRQAVEPDAGRGRRRLLCLGNQQPAAPLISCPLRATGRRLAWRGRRFRKSRDAEVSDQPDAGGQEP